MSKIKRYLEALSIEIGRDGIIDDEVLREAERRNNLKVLRAKRRNDFK